LSSFSFSTVIHGKHRDYVVKTTNFDSIRRIIINVNDNDRVLNTREIAYPGNLQDEELMGMVKKNHEERVETLQQLLKISGKLEQKAEVDSNQKLGMVFLNHGMGKEAAEEFSRALELDQQNAAIWNYLGLARLQEEDLPEAERCFRQALALKPNYPDLHNNLGLVLMRTEKFAEAMAEFQQALSLHQGYAEAYFNMGLCQLSQALDAGGLEEKAKLQMQKHLSRAIELNAYFNNEYYKVAQNYLAKNQLNEARQALIEAKTSVSSQTGSEIYHEFYLRLKYGEEGVDRKATERYISKLEELLDRYPNFVDVHNDLGVAYLIQCRFLFNRAINEFKRALAINANYAKAQKNLKLAENEGKGFLILLRAILYF